MGKTVYFITGTSSGIGKSLANLVLRHSSVIGLSRNNSLDHEQYTHISQDLAKLSEEDIDQIIKQLNEYENVHVVHNAGMIEPIAPVASISYNVFESNHKVNFLAPVRITNALLNQLKGKIKTITFIGSGAARHTIDAWSAYCSSKAALLMFAKCLQDEFKARNTPLKVYDISPGVINTPMQEKIRQSDQELFLQKERFENLYKNDELAAPEEVAMKIDYILRNNKTFESIEVNLREFTLPDNQ